MQQKAVGLVVVLGGVAYTYAPEHVDIRVVDMDNLEDPDEKTKVQLPAGVGFEHLVSEAEVVEYIDFICPKCGDVADRDLMTGTAHCKCEYKEPS
jgi:phage FluMu protein Com